MANNVDINTMNLIYICVGVFLLFALSFIISIKIQQSKKRKRKNKNRSFAFKMKYLTRDNYLEPIRYLRELGCLDEMLNPNLTNVIFKKQNESSTLYIGDLEWESKEKSKADRNADFLGTFLLILLQSDDNEKLKNMTSMIFIEDFNFDLPSFNMIKESIAKKAIEFFHLNKTEDIDFEDDKTFSGAWWLSSEQNFSVKDLFTRNIRTNLMKFVDKGYNIIGYKHLLIIITNKLYETENYYQLISDMKEIHKIFKSNKNFYKSNN